MATDRTFAGLLIEYLHDAVVGVDGDHRVTLVNQRAETLFGKTRKQLLGKPLDILLPESIRAHHADRIKDFLTQSTRARPMRGGEPVEAVGGGGASIFVEATIVRTADFSEETVAVAVLRDVTEQRSIRQTLKQASRIFATADEGIIVTDANTRILTINQAFAEITGYTEEEVRGQTPAILQSGLQDATFYKSMWQSILETGQWRGEIWNRRKSGETYPELLTISAVPDENDQITNYVGLFSDISPIRDSEARLKELTNFDPLTGLCTSKSLRDHLEHALERAHSTGAKGALLLANLGRFNMINESLGVTTGDQILQRIAARLRVGLDDELTIARTRGDEFGVLSPDLSCTDNPEALAKRIKSFIEEPINLAGGREVRLSTTIGISVFPADGTDVSTIMQAADTARHRARDDCPSGGYVFFDAAHTLRARAFMDLELQLHHAVEHKEFVIHYQPVVDISDGAVVGAEALVRWLHPERGLLGPGEFMGVAEATGLIAPIGDQVLARACNEAAAWHASGHGELPVAVNLSAHQFRSGDLLTVVERAIADTGLPAELLTLEITETTLMEQDSNVLEVVNDLHRVGIRLAIDDFGTGYSSLAYLKRFNADILKVDQSFIRPLPADRDSGQIVAAILALARGLNIDVVVEGVETDAQRRFLQELGATRFQGYLASAPVDAAAFKQLLRRSDGLLPDTAA